MRLDLVPFHAAVDRVKKKNLNMQTRSIFEHVNKINFCQKLLVLVY